MSLELCLDPRRNAWRKRVFENLDKYLELIMRIVKGIDGSASIYLFGSAAEGEYIVVSDIDVLIVTRD